MNRNTHGSNAKPSEFNLQLLQIREREDEVKKAIETSDMLLRLKGPASSRRLKEISTSSRLHPGDTIPSTAIQEKETAAINQTSDG